jgi:D-ornithine 4,5-aminomutase subunit beta
MATETGLDATFGRGTKGIQVVDAIVKSLRAREAGSRSATLATTPTAVGTAATTGQH